MSRRCEFTGVGPAYGNKVSHSNIKTRTRWLPNIKKKKYIVTELGQSLSLTLSTSAIKTIDKRGGLSQALLAQPEARLSERLLKLKRSIAKARAS